MKTKTNESRSTSRSKSSKETLEDIFEDMLKDIYWAEKNLLKAIPKMAKASHSEELTEAFNLHLEQTQAQIGRIEKCFDLLEKKASVSKCEAMNGLIKEGEDTIEKYEKGHARDAAIIAAAQQIEELAENINQLAAEMEVAEVE